MKKTQLATMPNLRLAWRRITTGTNQQYKRYFRHLYYAYEIALDENLRDLRRRILGGSWTPTPPTRVYIPKASGLQRPLSLLHLEDQIVLQAFSNLAAKKVDVKRKPLQLRQVFSNVVSDAREGLFFFGRWQVTYRAFQRKTRRLFDSGLNWIADFDLSAFYDTISHELLLGTLYPRTGLTDDVRWMLDCLGCWSSSQSSLGHGLPQGPIASDFLAECFLLPIDIKLSTRQGYIRYVDDIRLFGRTEDEVRRAVLELEQLCRERGLVPQTSKFNIHRPRSLPEALDMLPSLGPLDSDKDEPKLDSDEAVELLVSALEGFPRKIVDRSKARFVLFRAPPSEKMLRRVLPLVERHPEHADAFFTHLKRYGYRKPIHELCYRLVTTNPYSFLQGEAWHFLATYLRWNKISPEQHQVLIRLAVELAKTRDATPFIVQWGVMHFLAVCTELEVGNYLRFLKNQRPLVQAAVGPYLPDSAYQRRGPVPEFLTRDTPEPGLSVVGKIHGHRVGLEALDVDARTIHTSVSASLVKLGVIEGPLRTSDPVGELLSRRYGIPKSNQWEKLFGSEYMYAAGLLAQGDAVFLSGPSEWLLHQNSFNDALLRNLQDYMQRNGLPGVVRTINRNGELISLGRLLDPANSFSSTYPRIADAFRQMNARRNEIPAAHPYSTKTTQRNRFLSAQERNTFVALLRDAYIDVLNIIN